MPSKKKEREFEERDDKLRIHLDTTFEPGDKCKLCGMSINSRNELKIMVDYSIIRGHYFHVTCVDEWREENKLRSLSQEKGRTDMPSPKYHRPIPSSNSSEVRARGQRRKRLRGE